MSPEVATTCPGAREQELLQRPARKRSHGDVARSVHCAGRDRLCALAPERFLSGETLLRAMAFQMPELGILALAMMIPLMSGGAIWP